MTLPSFPPWKSGVGSSVTLRQMSYCQTTSAVCTRQQGTHSSTYVLSQHYDDPERRLRKAGLILCHSRQMSYRQATSAICTTLQGTHWAPKFNSMTWPEKDAPPRPPPPSPLRGVGSSAIQGRCLTARQPLQYVPHDYRVPTWAPKFNSMTWPENDPLLLPPWESGVGSLLDWMSYCQATSVCTRQRVPILARFNQQYDLTWKRPSPFPSPGKGIWSCLQLSREMSYCQAPSAVCTLQTTGYPDRVPTQAPIFQVSMTWKRSPPGITFDSQPLKADG